jgi:hypothetical protein
MRDESKRFEGDEEVGQLFRSSVVESRPVDLDELLKRSKSMKAMRDRQRFSTRRLMMTSGVCAGGLMAVLLFQMLSSATVVFGQVKEKVRGAENVRYVQTRSSDGEDLEALEGRNVIQMYRHEIDRMKSKEASLKGDELGELKKKIAQWEEGIKRIEKRMWDQGERAWKRRVMILGRSLKREDVEAVGGDYVVITDVREGRVVTLMPAEKKMVVIKRQKVVDLKSGKEEESEIQGSASADLYSQMKDVPDNAAPLAERKRVEGVDLIGFQKVETHGNSTWTRTFWVDPSTNLPRRIEVSSRSTNPMVVASDWVLSEIEFNIEMDESLFQTEVPEGYEVEEQVLEGYRVD